MTQAGQRDVISVLIQDHQEVDELFVRLEELASTRHAPGCADERGEARRVAGQVAVELSGHWAAEERYLYPLLRTRVPGGAELAERETAGHARMGRELTVLDALDPGGEEFWLRTSALIDQVRAQLRDEEGELFPRLRGAVPQAALVALAGAVDGRPRPAARIRTTEGVVNA
jgi:Hemerythrin HHE cation binding domain